MSISNFDDDNEVGLMNIGLIFSIIAFLVALFSFIFRTMWNKVDSKALVQYDEMRSSEESEKSADEESSKKSNPFRQNSKRNLKMKKIRETKYQHPWLLTTLKGHIAQVLDIDFSLNGKFLVSAGSDRSIYLWNTKDFYARSQKFSRGAVEFDNATHIVFAPDSVSILISLCMANKMREMVITVGKMLFVYKVTRKKEGCQGYKIVPVDNVEYPVKHKSDIKNIGVASTGKFVMSSDENAIALYSLRGDLFKILEPKLNFLHTVIISPCGRFLAAGGFTPDAIIYEVLFDRKGNFQDAKRVFDLKGHHSGIYAIAFNKSSSKCVTASKDGTWNLYNIDIRYSLGEDAKIIASGTWDLLKNAAPDTVHLAISPSGNSFVISASRHLKFFCALNPQKNFDIVLDIHQEPVTKVCISACGKLVATSGDRHMRIFHNVAEYYAVVLSLEKAVDQARAGAVKRDFEEELANSRKLLESIMKGEHKQSM